ncbi:MAG: hypothetical protein IT436_03550 [Phycisphaerales bacterium]|nr:hypothetical protein [Phycisphaerales bacterium]
MPACEEHVIYDRPMLAGLPGVETGRQVTGPRVQGAIPPDAVTDDNIVIDNPDGTTTLVSRTGRHLMIHIYNTLQEDEGDLFVEQLLAQRTRDEYYRRGLQPIEAFNTLKKRRADIKKLFDQMPMGEYTPGIYVRSLADKVTRLEVSGAGARDLAWTCMDITFEDGNWKLVWFDGPSR